MKLLRFLLVIAIGTSFITRPILFGRATPGDVFGLLSIIVLLLIVANRKLFFPNVAYAGLGLVIAFSLGVVMSGNKVGTLIEVSILFFLYTFAIAIINAFKSEEGLLWLLKAFCITCFIASAIGFWDLVGDFLPIPRVFSRRFISNKGGYYTYGEIISGFRNAGQAGAYMLVALTILLPIKHSILGKQFSGRFQFFLSITIIMVLLFLLLSAKVAAYIGLIAGVLLSVVMRKNIKAFKPIVVVTCVAVFSYSAIKTAAPNVIGRIEFKVRTRVLEKFVDDNSKKIERNGKDFQNRNYSAALQAFVDNPFTAAGIGGFNGIYDSHEVHSTPLKLLGETGIFGIIAYMFFMTYILIIFSIKKYSRVNPYRDYLFQMFPFFLGALFSWGYTYHLRKREFWILLSIVVITHYCLQEWEKNRNQQMVL